jgi:hypothetical protein
VNQSQGIVEETSVTFTTGCSDLKAIQDSSHNLLAGVFEGTVPEILGAETAISCWSFIRPAYFECEIPSSVATRVRYE